MKKLILSISFGLLISSLFGQSTMVVDYYKWSDPATFQISTPPRINGWGQLSDSLSNIFNGTLFYKLDDKYMPIESWADYYLWYTREYYYLFHVPTLYEYYYQTSNDYQMAAYIAGNSYKYDYYPSNFTLRFTGKPFNENRLAKNHSITLTKKQEQKFVKYTNRKQKEYKNIKYNDPDIHHIKKESKDINHKRGYKTSYKNRNSSTNSTFSTPVRSSYPSTNLESSKSKSFKKEFK